MHIFWKGQSCFQILVNQTKKEQISIVIDPFSEEIGLKVPRFKADILLITHSHYDHNNVKAVEGEAFVIESPGEYEIRGVVVQGILSFHDEVFGKKRGLNTIYTIEAEGLRLCHLGDFGQPELTSEQIDDIGKVDVLFIPVGGVYTIDARVAAKVISQLEPRVVIPMHYHLPKLKIKLDEVDKFLKIMGRKSVIPEPKLLVKKKDLSEDGSRIVVLNP